MLMPSCASSLSTSSTARIITGSGGTANHHTCAAGNRKVDIFKYLKVAEPFVNVFKLYYEILPGIDHRLLAYSLKELIAID